MAWYYLSTWGGIGTRDFPFTPVAFPAIDAAGGVGACFDLRSDCTKVAGFALVASSVQLGSLPSGVTALFDDTGLDSALAAAKRTVINAALGTTIGTGLTARQALRAVATVQGVGKWGQVLPDVDGKVRLHFGGAGSLDL